MEPEPGVGSHVERGLSEGGAAPVAAWVSTGGRPGVIRGREPMWRQLLPGPGSIVQPQEHRGGQWSAGTVHELRLSARAGGGAGGE